MHLLGGSAVHLGSGRCAPWCVSVLPSTVPLHCLLSSVFWAHMSTYVVSSAVVTDTRPRHRPAGRHIAAACGESGKLGSPEGT